MQTFLDSELAKLGFLGLVLVAGFSIAYWLLKKLIEDRFEIMKSEEMENFRHQRAKDFQIFEKRKEALTAVLLLVSEAVLKVKKGYDLMTNEFRLISETYCEELELKLSQHVLYVDSHSQELLGFILEVLNANSTWLSDATGDNELSFNSEDLDLVEFLYQLLVTRFKDQLFGSQKGVLVTPVAVAKSAYLLAKLAEKRHLDHKELGDLSYRNVPMALAVINIKNDMGRAVDLLGKGLRRLKKAKVNKFVFRLQQIVERTLESLVELNEGKDKSSGNA